MSGDKCEFMFLCFHWTCWRVKQCGGYFFKGFLAFIHINVNLKFQLMSNMKYVSNKLVYYNINGLNSGGSFTAPLDVSVCQSNILSYWAVIGPAAVHHTDHSPSSTLLWRHGVYNKLPRGFPVTFSSLGDVKTTNRAVCSKVSIARADSNVS